MRGKSSGFLAIKRQRSCRLCVVDRVTTKPVLIANGAHFLHGRAAHARRKLARLPGQPDNEPNRAARHAEAHCLRASIAADGKTRSDESGAGTDCCQAKGPAGRGSEYLAQGLSL